MARPRLPDLRHLAVAGAEVAVRVTPRAGVCDVTEEGGRVAVRVMAAPDRGQANRAAQALLAEALGVAKTRLTLVRGAASRDKTFRVER